MRSIIRSILENLGGRVILLSAAVLAAVVLYLVIVKWFLYLKAGERGWAVLVPFYHPYVMAKITWGCGWLFLLTFLPVGNIIYFFATCIKLSQAFGKGCLFGMFLFLFPVIFLPILAFGKTWYCKPISNKKRNAKLILPTALIGAACIAGIVISGLPGTVLSMVRLLAETEELEDMEEDADGGIASGSEKIPIEGYDYLLYEILENDAGMIQVPVLDGDPYTYTGDGVVSRSCGVTTALYLSGQKGADNTELVSTVASLEAESLEAESDVYSDITVSDVVKGSNYAMLQISFNYTDEDGETYPCFEIIKSDSSFSSNVLILLAMDNASATEETSDIFAEACEAYSIDFEYAGTDEE